MQVALQDIGQLTYLRRRVGSGTAADWCLNLGKLRKLFKPSFTGLICRYASDQG